MGELALLGKIELARSALASHGRRLLTSGSSTCLYSEMVSVTLWIALVTSSGAGPPLEMLNLIPKSFSGPPGLCEAVSRIPPSVLSERMSAETAGVDRIESTPTMTCLIPLPAAIRRIFCVASGD